MAKIYGHNDAVDFAAKNLITFNGSFARGAGQPLDKTAIWYPKDGVSGYNRALAYAATDAAYVGQELAVIDVTYAEDGTTVTGTSVKFYGIQDAAGTLKELGAKPTGDDASIEVDASGLVSVFGFAGAQNGTLPVRENGVLTWKTLEDIGAGDGNDNTTYQFAANEAGNGFVVTPLFNGQPIKDGETQVKYEVALNVYTKTEVDAKLDTKASKTELADAVAAEKTRAEAAEAKALSDAKEYAKEYTDAEAKKVADRVTELETAVNDEATGLAKHEERIQAMETFWSATEDSDGIVNKLKEIQDYIASDETGAAAMAGDIKANADAIKVLNGDDAGSVNKKIADAIAPLATTEAVDTELAKKVDVATYNADKETFAVKSDVNTELGKKVNVSDYNAEKATFATKEELTAHSNTAEATYAKKADVYTTEQIDTMIAGINQGNQESASAVNTKLTNYITSNDKEIANLKEKDAALTTAVEAAQARADKGVEDASKASQAVTQLEQGQVFTNKTNIENLSAVVSGTGADDKTSHAYKIGQLEAANLAHATEFTTLSGKVDTNSAEIANKANASDVYTKAEAKALIDAKADAATTYSKDEVDAKVKDAIDKIPEVDFTPYAKVVDVDVIYKAGVDGGAATGVLADEITRAKAAEKANADAISALVGTDTDKTIRAIAAEETAAIVAGADSKYDTLKEIADFIMNDETGAAAMANDIAALKTKVDTGTKTVSAYVNDAIATIIQPKASAEVTVAADGTLGIGEINVNKLTQTAGDTLILNGGKA